MPEEANPYADMYAQALKTNAPAQNTAPSAAEPSALSKAGNFASDVGKGLGESAVSLMSTGDEFARKHLPAFLTNTGMGFGKPANLEHVHEMATPANTTQAVSKGIGDAAQFMIPDGAAEKAASMLPKAAQGIGKIGLAALSAGGVNKAQGGSFGAGAAGGATGGAIGEGLRAVAPKLAESALGIGKADRAFSKTPGRAILDETKGIRPESIAQSGQESLNKLTPELERAADAASMRPAPKIRGFLQPPMTETSLHTAGGAEGRLSQPITLNQADRPMPLGLAAPRNISGEIPLVEHPGADPATSPMAFRAERMQQANISGFGTDAGEAGSLGRTFRELGSTTHTIPPRLTREAFLSGSEHPELSGQIPVSEGILRRFEESRLQSHPGMGPAQYIGEIPGERGGPGQVQGVLRTRPEMSNSIPPTIGPNPTASLRGARAGIAAEQGKHLNAPSLFDQLGDMRDNLGIRQRGPLTGQDIPDNVTPRDLLNLKRDFSHEFLGRWNPETHGTTIATGRNAYHALDSELDRTVPEAAGLNQRISSLIPVVHRAESVSRNAPTIQRALGRFGAHTGALTLGGIGAVQGGHSAGVPGAIAGGLTGVLAPELIASPEGRMALARMANASKGLRPAVGGALQLTRGNQ